MRTAPIRRKSFAVKAPLKAAGPPGDRGSPRNPVSPRNRVSGGLQEAAMEKISVEQARQEDTIGKTIKLQGWIRTRRDSKAGFSFLELNDGSCFGNVQIIAESRLPNYESEIKKLPAGASVTVVGEVRKSPAQGQPTEVLAEQLTVHGWADPEAYPL